MNGRIRYVSTTCGTTARFARQWRWERAAELRANCDRLDLGAEARKGVDSYRDHGRARPGRLPERPTVHPDHRDGRECHRARHSRPVTEHVHFRRSANAETLPSGASPSVTRKTFAPYATS